MAGKLKTDEIAKLPHPLAMNAIIESVMDEYEGTYGPQRLCTHICNVFYKYPKDPSYIQELNSWTKAMNAICAIRGIDFDAEVFCAQLMDDVWGKPRLDTRPKQAKTKVLQITRTFEHRIRPADAIWARGIGIKLN